MLAAVVAAVGSPPAATPAGGATTDPPTVDTAEIEVVFEAGVDLDAPYDDVHDADDPGDLRWTVFTNPAYACEDEGGFWFVVVERVADAGRVRPLWVRFDGLNLGIRDPSGSPVPDVPFYLRSPPDWARASATPEDKAEMAERIRADAGATLGAEVLDRGFRVLLPGTCDTDAYTGLGQRYRNHPDNDQTVDGALASMSAVEHVVTAPDGTPGAPDDKPRRPTSQIFLWGASAGAIGAHRVMAALAEAGIVVTGAIMDSGTATDTLREVWTDDDGLRLPATLPDLAFLEAVGAKLGDLGPSATHDAWIASGGTVPTLTLYDVRDAACGGDDAPLTDPAAPAWFDGESCDYAYAPVADAARDHPAGHHQVARYDETAHGFAAHVLTTQPGHPAVAAAVRWIDEVLAADAPTPWPYLPAHPYPDVPSDPDEDRSAYDAASWAADQGIVDGYAGGTCASPAPRCLGPGEAVSRQAMAAFLHRLSGAPAVEVATATFADVPPAHPFHQEIEWMAVEGHAQGYPCGASRPCFDPTRPVSRQAAAAFLHQLAGAPATDAGAGGPAFADVPPDHPFATAIGWLAATGLSVGYPCGEARCFAPERAVSRRAAVELMHRLAGTPGAWADPAPAWPALTF